MNKLKTEPVDKGPGQEDEATLIRQAQREPAAFQAIYRNWVTRIYQFILARVSDQADAEDLTSQVFLSAYQALPGYRDKGQFAAWLFTIARNQVNGHFRSKKVTEVPLESLRHASADADALKTIIHGDEIECLSKLIQTLPEREQELIQLRYVAELRFADIATVLGRREDAVKKNLYRIQARLQIQLEEGDE